MARLVKLPNLGLVLISYAVVGVSIIFYFLAKKDLPPEVPLYYGMPAGAEQLAGVGNLILPAVIAFFVVSINTILGSFSKDSFVQKVLGVTGFGVAILCLVSVVKIAFLVGNI